MLNFKLIEKSDINKFQKYYDNPEGISLTTNILSAYLWRNEYNIKFALYNNCLIKAYFNDDDSVWGYCLPHGEDIKPACRGNHKGRSRAWAKTFYRNADRRTES